MEILLVEDDAIHALLLKTFYWRTGISLRLPALRWRRALHFFHGGRILARMVCIHLRFAVVKYGGKDIQADPQALDKLVNTWKSRATATLVIDREVLIGFQANRKRVEELLA